MISLPIAGLYSAISVILIMVLVFRVIYLRRTLRIGIGDGGDRRLALAIRAHANAIETIPMTLLLLALLEFNGGASSVLHGMGSALVIGRVLHALGLSQHLGVSFGRFWGMVITLAVMLGLAVLNLLAFFQA